MQKKILNIPEDYYVGIVSASATGAVETLTWSLLGERGVDVLACCLFSNYWAHDIVDELKISDVNVIKEDFPKAKVSERINFDRDFVFCMTSTTSGASFHDTNWIPNDRKGLVICDATSAIFSIDFDWRKLDAVAFSWQKGIGAEAGLGTIVLSPRAIARLESYTPDRPIPKIFRIAHDKKINFDFFNGYTLNTPSMICLEEFYHNLLWADQLGGIKALSQKVERNYEIVKNWLAQQNTFCFLVDEKYRARHIACLDITSEMYQTKSTEDKWIFLKKIVNLCEKENVGFDFLGHILTVPHLRIWMGPTIESQDLKKFLPWLQFAYDEVVATNR
jgi:phosphoserine aminotransferase